LSIAPDPFVQPSGKLKLAHLMASRQAFGQSVGALTKVVFDRLVALVALITLAPVMAVVATLILMRRDGPVFFSHPRVGRGGKIFRCHKFRTMVPNGGALFEQVLAIDPVARDDWEIRRKVFRDPRVSRLGAFLRSSSLDELPQFWNVLCGEMSMVGPRPVTAEELEHYGEAARDYMTVRPGITGIWQVSGRSGCTFAERVALDVGYVRNLSFAQDIAILFRTVKVVLSHEGAA